MSIEKKAVDKNKKNLRSERGQTRNTTGVHGTYSEEPVPNYISTESEEVAVILRLIQ